MALDEYSLGALAQEWGLSLCLAAILCYLTFKSTNLPKRFPPGPRGFPILGVAPFVGRRPEIAFANWSKKYGDVIGVKMGNNYTVVLNSYEAIKEAFVKKAAVFSHRPDNFLFSDILKKRGIGFSDYTPEYIEERKFVMNTINKLGFGKTSMEASSVDEAEHLVEQFGDKDVELNEETKERIMYATGNIIAQVAIGRRYSDYNHPEFRRFMDGWLYFFHTASLAYLVSVVFPWFRHFPPIRGMVRDLHEEFAKISGVARKEIFEHEKTLDETEKRDFIDEYLSERKKKAKPDEEGAYTEEQLDCFVRDLFGAGMETVTSTIIFSILILANRPEMMKKIHDEIDDIIGHEDKPRYALREKMPFFQAFVLETLRYRSVGPLAVPHCASENVTFRGYTIPKGTTVIANIYAVHNDPKNWDKPEEFIPERHLDSNGKLILSKYCMPFSSGPRLCIGRRLAEMELFILLVTIFRRYTVIPTPTATCERPYVNDDSSITGITLCPPENTPVTLVRRKLE